MVTGLFVRREARAEAAPATATASGKAAARDQVVSDAAPVAFQPAVAVASVAPVLTPIPLQPPPWSKKRTADEQESTQDWPNGQAAAGNDIRPYISKRIREVVVCPTPTLFQLCGDNGTLHCFVKWAFYNAWREIISSPSLQRSCIFRILDMMIQFPATTYMLLDRYKCVQAERDRTMFRLLLGQIVEMVRNWIEDGKKGGRHAPHLRIIRLVDAVAYDNDATEEDVSECSHNADDGQDS